MQFVWNKSLFYEYKVICHIVEVPLVITKYYTKYILQGKYIPYCLLSFA